MRASGRADLELEVAGDGLVGVALATGTVTAGIGVVSYLIGAALNRPARWQLEVSGKVVKRTSPAVQAARPVTEPAR